MSNHIDLEHEEKFSLKEACKFPELRRNGKAPNICTPWRWASAGKLETVRIGGQVYTTREAVRRMIARDNSGAAIPTISPRQRVKQIGEAEHRLEMAGV